MKTKKTTTPRTTRTNGRVGATPKAVLAEPTRKTLVVAEPKYGEITLRIRGTTAYVQNRFGTKAFTQMRQTQEAGQSARSKRFRAPKDFDAAFRDSLHVSTEGWYGIPVGALRNAMIDACRAVGVTMTHAKMAVFVIEDGVDANEGCPLVRITKGEPEKLEMPVRNDNGSADIRARGMFRPGWEATVRLRFDEDMIAAKDVVNLMIRVGQQVGIGEGRYFSKKSCGMGWGCFIIVEDKR